MARTPKKTDVESLSHPDASRLNIPTAEQQSFVAKEEAAPKPLVWPRNTQHDPQLVWRGKDLQADALTVPAVPIYVQEKIHPEAIIADLRRRSDAAREEASDSPSLFADAYPEARPEDAYEFYSHEGRWQNRMILGDSLLVMASLAGKEALRGQVQCVYLDPPYGIKFNSNWQPSTRSRDVKDGKLESLTREPEMVRAFRDTWRDGVHSYLDYLRDRLVLARDLLSDSGSCFVQIGDENVHLVRALMDEVFGRENFVSSIAVKKTSGATGDFLPGTIDHILFFAKERASLKYHQILFPRSVGEDGDETYRFIDKDLLRWRLSFDEIKALRGHPDELRIYRQQTLTSQAVGRAKGEGEASWFAVGINGNEIRPSSTARWKTNQDGMRRLLYANRIETNGKSISYVRFHGDFPVFPVNDLWADTQSGSAMDKIYVVQTSQKIVERCLLMSTDPGDLVLDPTCGSGTTAFVAEQWGRRWITVDTSRVALALARQRLMAGRFDAWLLQDTPEGARKEGELTGRPPTPERLADLSRPNRRPRLKGGFVLHRVPHIMLKSIAKNAEIDTIWDRWQTVLEPLRAALNAATEQAWEEWEIPREPGDPWPAPAAAAHTEARAALADERDPGPALAKLLKALGRALAAADLPEKPRDPWPEATEKLHADWWAARRARQAEIDASIARNADTEYLVGKPYPAKGKVRVCGPFTVESLSPHRVLPTDEEEDAALAAELNGGAAPARTRSLTRAAAEARAAADFTTVVLENLRASGVQNTKKGERLEFTELKAWSGGGAIAAEGRYQEGDRERRVAVAIGPEYGTVGWQFVREAARDAVELFDTLVVCGFAFEPQVNDEAFTRLGGLTVLKARMNNDLHMAGALKPNGAGNLFVVFGEPDVKVRPAGKGMLEAEIMGLDVFDPTTGAVRSSDLADIACWFLDHDYDGESFFVRHAYFLGGNDPYEKLRNTLKAEIDAEAWDALYSATSRPFPEPAMGRVAVKVINHYGDEVMKVFQKGRDW